MFKKTFVTALSVLVLFACNQQQEAAQAPEIKPALEVKILVRNATEVIAYIADSDHPQYVELDNGDRVYVPKKACASNNCELLIQTLDSLSPEVAEKIGGEFSTAYRFTATGELNGGLILSPSGSDLETSVLFVNEQYLSTQSELIPDIGDIGILEGGETEAVRLGRRADRRAVGYFCQGQCPGNGTVAARVQPPPRRPAACEIQCQFTPPATNTFVRVNTGCTEAGQVCRQTCANYSEFGRGGTPAFSYPHRSICVANPEGCYRSGDTFYWGVQQGSDTPRAERPRAACEALNEQICCRVNAFPNHTYSTKARGACDTEIVPSPGFCTPPAESCRVKWSPAQPEDGVTLTFEIEGAVIAPPEDRPRFPIFTYDGTDVPSVPGNQIKAVAGTHRVKASYLAPGGFRVECPEKEITVKEAPQVCCAIGGEKYGYRSVHSCASSVNEEGYCKAPAGGCRVEPPLPAPVLGKLYQVNVLGVPEHLTASILVNSAITANPILVDSLLPQRISAGYVLPYEHLTLVICDETTFTAVEPECSVTGPPKISQGAKMPLKTDYEAMGEITFNGQLLPVGPGQTALFNTGAHTVGFQFAEGKIYPVEGRPDIAVDCKPHAFEILAHTCEVSADQKTGSLEGFRNDSLGLNAKVTSELPLNTYLRLKVKEPAKPEAIFDAGLASSVSTDYTLTDTSGATIVSAVIVVDGEEVPCGNEVEIIAHEPVCSVDGPEELELRASGTWSVRPPASPGPGTYYLSNWGGPMTITDTETDNQGFTTSITGMADDIGFLIGVQGAVQSNLTAQVHLCEKKTTKVVVRSCTFNLHDGQIVAAGETLNLIVTSPGEEDWWRWRHHVVVDGVPREYPEDYWPVSESATAPITFQPQVFVPSQGFVNCAPAVTLNVRPKVNGCQVVITPKPAPQENTVTISVTGDAAGYIWDVTKGGTTVGTSPSTDFTVNPGETINVRAKGRGNFDIYSFFECGSASYTAPTKTQCRPGIFGALFVGDPCPTE